MSPLEPRPLRSFPLLLSLQKKTLIGMHKLSLAMSCSIYSLPALFPQNFQLFRSLLLCSLFRISLFIRETQSPSFPIDSRAASRTTTPRLDFDARVVVCFSASLLPLCTFSSHSQFSFSIQQQQQQQREYVRGFVTFPITEIFFFPNCSPFFPVSPPTFQFTIYYFIVIASFRSAKLRLHMLVSLQTWEFGRLSYNSHISKSLAHQICSKPLDVYLFSYMYRLLFYLSSIIYLIASCICNFFA